MINNQNMNNLRYTIMAHKAWRGRWFALGRQITTFMSSNNSQNSRVALHRDSL